MQGSWVWSLIGEPCPVGQKNFSGSLSQHKFLTVLLLFTYSAVPGLNRGMLALVPWPGVEPEQPALGVWSLSHWTTREVPRDWSLFPAVSCYLAFPCAHGTGQVLPEHRKTWELSTPPSMELSGEYRAGIKSIQSDFFPHQNHKVSTPERKE